jgi:hypothetical protein
MDRFRLGLVRLCAYNRAWTKIEAEKDTVHLCTLPVGLLFQGD